MRSKGLGALVLSAAMIGLAAPASALAAKPAATTGAASKITFSSAQLNGSVDPNKEADDLLLPVRHARSPSAPTPPRPPPAPAPRPRAGASTSAGSRRVTRYYYRLVARNASGTTLGKRRSFTTSRQPLGVSLTASAEPGQGRQLGDHAVRHADRHRQRRPQGRAADEVVAVHDRLRERHQRAGHQRHRRLLVPDPERCGSTPSTGCRCPSARGREPDRTARRQAVRQVQGQQEARPARQAHPLLRHDHAGRAGPAARDPEVERHAVGHRRRDVDPQRRQLLEAPEDPPRRQLPRLDRLDQRGSTPPTSARSSRSVHSGKRRVRRALLVPRRRRPGLVVGVPARRSRDGIVPRARRAAARGARAACGRAGRRPRTAARRWPADALAPGNPLELRREPGNEHDANAIAVHAGGAQVGFVPRELAAELAPELDAGAPVVGGRAARAARLAARPAQRA